MSKHLGVALLGLAGAAGCVTMPPPIVSPTASAPRAGGITWGSGWGFAHAYVRAPDGTIRAISTNGDHGYGEDNRNFMGPGLLFPTAFSLHLASESWDFGAYTGWRELGMTLRQHVWSATSGAITSLTESGSVHWSFQGADGSLALEQTVPLDSTVTVLLRLGASAGVRDYDIALPTEFTGRPDPGGAWDWGPTRFDLLRTDVRIEPVLGLAIGRIQGLTLGGQPYFVIAHGGLKSVRCQNECLAGAQLIDFSQQWGFTVALTMRAP